MENVTTYAVHLQKGRDIATQYIKHISAATAVEALERAKESIKKGYRVVRVDHKENGRTVIDGA
jgi:hypothetical protein